MGAETTEKQNSSHAKALFSPFWAFKYFLRGNQNITVLPEHLRKATEIKEQQQE
jgi:hypothetical protein